MSVEAEKEWIENDAKNGTYNFAIVDIKTDELIGNCGINHIDTINRTAEIGLFIGKEENRSKGNGTEVIKLLLDYGFNYLNLHNIDLKVKSFNKRAINCYKKVGFKEYGRRRESTYLNGKYYDDIYMDILSKEFTENCIKNKVNYEE